MSNELHSEMYHEVMDNVGRRIITEISLIQLMTRCGASSDIRNFMKGLMEGPNQFDMFVRLSDMMSTHLENETNHEEL